MNEFSAPAAADVELLQRVVLRLRPYLQGDTLRRSRLDGVLASSRADATLRVAVERVLATAGIKLIDDRPVESAKIPAQAGKVADRAESVVPRATDVVGARTHRLDAEASIVAARARMEADRWVRNLAKAILTAQEEVGLGLLIRAGGLELEAGSMAQLVGERRRAAETLFLHNLGLVHSVARAHGYSPMEYDDIVGNAYIGLIRAIELFDPAAGCKFSTYATHWIRQAITRGIANHSRLIRVPVHVHDRMVKVAQVYAKLSADGSYPSAAAVAAVCELSVAQVEESRRLSRGVASLDCPIGDGTATLADVVDLHQDEYEAVTVHGFGSEDLKAAMACLTEREADVVFLRFGFTDEPQTLEEIGSQYGVTRERIRQIEVKARMKLQAAFAAQPER